MAEPVTDGEDYDLHRQLAVIDTVTPISHSVSNPDSSAITPFSSPFSNPNGWAVPRYGGLRVDKTPESKWITTKFTLPEDWLVEKVPRKTGSGIDKYYHDPETGRRFRSLKDVERYLIEGCMPTRSRVKRLMYHEEHLKNRGNRKKIFSGGKMLDFDEDKDNQYQLVNLTPSSLPNTSHFWLPDGWIVEEVPRKTGDHVDKYYYEPGTGRRFRSLPAVQKHLAELEENSPLSVVLEELREDNLPLSKAFKLSGSIKNRCAWKKRVSKKKQDSSFSSPPSRINWVIASSKGGTWHAFVGDTLIQESLKQLWGKRFMLAINNSKHDAQILE